MRWASVLRVFLWTSFEYSYIALMRAEEEMIFLWFLGELKRWLLWFGSPMQRAVHCKRIFHLMSECAIDFLTRAAPGQGCTKDSSLVSTAFNIFLVNDFFFDKYYCTVTVLEGKSLLRCDVVFLNIYTCFCGSQRVEFHAYSSRIICWTTAKV